MARVEPTMPKVLSIEEGIAKIAGTVSDQSFAPKKERQRSQFAIIGHQAIDAMIKSAEEVVTKAQQELEAVKTRAQQMRLEFDQRDQEIAAMMERVTNFGNDQLNAHSKFTSQSNQNVTVQPQSSERLLPNN